MLQYKSEFEKMEPMAAAQARSATCGDTETEFHSQLGEELNNHLISVPPESSISSFTALLGLPANQAMELLVQAPAEAPLHAISPPPPPPPPPIFPNKTILVDRATKFSTLTSMDWVKQEPEESNSDPNSPAFSNDPDPKPTTKRKEREKKGKESIKKIKKAANEKTEDGGEKLPYVHVRARRGQATDSHSLAERARREKINARMKLLQELVPGCNKISGTATVLDEIINHVQSLQRQVEFLSMRLAAVNPRIDFNLDTLMAAESGSTGESNYQNVTAIMPPFWAEGHIQANRQEFQQQWYLNGIDHHSVWSREEENSIFITQDNSLLSYDSSGNSVPLHSNQLKMEM